MTDSMVQKPFYSYGEHDDDGEYVLYPNDLTRSVGNENAYGHHDRNGNDEPPKHRGISQFNFYHINFYEEWFRLAQPLSLPS
jgi:hypothetical protein